VADAWYNKAKKLEGDARKAAFKAAGDAYAKGAELKPTSADLPFNAALSYQSAEQHALAEAQWKATLKVRPDDKEAWRSLSSTLADEKKFPEAVEAAQKALGLDPKDKSNHRLLGAMYTKAGDNLRSKQALMAYLALEKGKSSETSSAASGAAGTKLQATAGKPDEIYQWEAEGQNYESWFYWSKGLAYHFSGGNQIEKSDWSAALAKQ
jgi:tetratricopeptide (TPR) repeat protein